MVNSQSLRVCAVNEAMSLSRINGRQNSLSSISSSSMESLSSSHGASSLIVADQELTITLLRTKTSDYDTSATEYDEDKKHNKKSGRVRKVNNQFSTILRY